MERFISCVNFIKSIMKEKPICAICISVIALLITFVDVKCIDDFYKAGNGHYYQLFVEDTDWYTARKKCIDECGHLVQRILSY